MSTHLDKLNKAHSITNPLISGSYNADIKADIKVDLKMDNNTKDCVIAGIIVTGLLGGYYLFSKK